MVVRLISHGDFQFPLFCQGLALPWNVRGGRVLNLRVFASLQFPDESKDIVCYFSRIHSRILISIEIPAELRMILKLLFSSSCNLPSNSSEKSLPCRTAF